MLSVKSIGAADSGVASYYEQLAQDDYYSNGTEPPGHWYGQMTSGLDLAGTVRPGQLKSLFEGCHPITQEPLVPNAGPDHKAGWDLTFSAPKSVSVIWALTDESHRVDVAQAHESAVAAAMAYLEQRAFASRDRNPGNHQQGIVAATFEHGCSRELDPQLHTHCVVANLSARLDGTYGAVDFDTRWKMAAGAVYRAELASQLKEMGYGIERDAKSFKVAGVTEGICEHFSKRRNQIETELEATGHAGAKASAIAAMQTRQAKVNIDRDTLHHEWQAQAIALGFDWQQVKRVTQIKQAVQVQQETSPDLAWPSPVPCVPTAIDIKAIVQTLTDTASTFTPMQLESAVAIAAQGSLSAVQIEATLKASWQELLTDPSALGLVELREFGVNQRRNNLRYTTNEILKLETNLLKDARARAIEARHITSCANVLADSPTLSSEQLTALLHITEEPGAVKVVEGLAGTGKSYLLRAASQAWQGAGLNVIGVALAGKAADSLQQGSGIHSQTLHSLLAELDDGNRTLSSRNVVVLDEAGMVGTRQMARLLDHVHQAGAKAVLVGDSMQLQPIDAGGMFRKLSHELGHSSLTDIRRQDEATDRQMIHDIIAGRSEDVINSLEDNGQLRTTVGPDIMVEMVKEWQLLRTPDQPSETVMLAGTRAEVKKLNTLARESLKLQHRLHSEITLQTETGEREFAVGERIVFTRNNQELGVKNGQTGTLTAWGISNKGSIVLTVAADSGNRVEFDSSAYGHFDHGYALSVHKSQGQTIDNVLVLLSESMTDKQWGYVAASRHRKELRVFVPTELQDELVPMLARSRQKEVALDYEQSQTLPQVELKQVKQAYLEMEGELEL